MALSHLRHVAANMSAQVPETKLTTAQAALSHRARSSFSAPAAARCSRPTRPSAGARAALMAPAPINPRTEAAQTETNEFFSLFERSLVQYRVVAVCQVYSVFFERACFEHNDVCPEPVLAKTACSSMSGVVNNHRSSRRRNGLEKPNRAPPKSCAFLILSVSHHHF